MRCNIATIVSCIGIALVLVGCQGGTSQTKGADTSTSSEEANATANTSEKTAEGATAQSDVSSSAVVTSADTSVSDEATDTVSAPVVEDEAISPWLGTWVAESGESLEIYAVSDDGLSLVFNKFTEIGKPISVDYEMAFDDDAHTVASEMGDVVERTGWKYTFILGDGYITVTSRYPDQVFWRASDEGPATTPSEEPFWGVWAYASKDPSEAEGFAADARQRGFAAEVLMTTDWSNLNSEPWYVVTLGRAYSEGEADALCERAHADVYGDAYVKYSGERIQWSAP